METEKGKTAQNGKIISDAENNQNIKIIYVSSSEVEKVVNEVLIEYRNLFDKLKDA